MHEKQRVLTCLLLGMVGLCGYFVKKEKRAQLCKIQREILCYIENKAVAVQCNTAQRDANVPLEKT